MRERIISRGTTRHKGPVFIPTLWVALATALLCALWPSGLPLTKTIGSAFSPETSAVALRGRAEQIRFATQRFEKDDDHASAAPGLTGPSAPALFPQTPSLPSPAIAERPAWRAYAIAPPLPHASGTQAWPRAPPRG